MGIYTDYGRFQKAREFKNYCNSGAGIWFAFSMGSPRWDEIIHKNLNGSEDTTDILNVPPSAPAAYTPLYRWFASYKNGAPTESTEILQLQELSLIDRSFCVTEDSQRGYTKGTLPSNAVIATLSNPGGEGEIALPTDKTTPTILTLNKNRMNEGDNTPIYRTIDGNIPASDSLDSHTWSEDQTQVDKAFYPTPSLPAFPVSYMCDWENIITKAGKDLADPLYLFYQQGSVESGGNDQWTEPTDSTKFESWAYIQHLSLTKEDKDHHKSDTSCSSYRPLGLYSFIQGMAKFVEPVSEEMAQNSTISTFKYGSHYWRIVPDANITEDNLPHHILLTVSVFPNELSDSSIVERFLPVRQVSVFKFPDCILDQIPELTQTNPARRYQVLKRGRFNIVRKEDTIPDISTIKDTAWENGRQIYLPFYIDDPGFDGNIYLNPNPVNTDSTTRLRGTIEMLINDFMTARKRDVQQTDRYGYIIGF